MNDDEIMSKLKLKPEIKSKSEVAQALYYVSLVPAGIGGYFIGRFMGKTIADDKTDTAGGDLLIGVGVLAVGIGLLFISNQNLHEAVEMNNSSISKTGFLFNGTQLGYRF
jgi:hypothetical protein